MKHMIIKLLTRAGALLITNPTNIRYLTGFVGVDAGEREAYVLLTKDTLYLFTNSLYKEAAQQLSNPTNKPINKPMMFVEISKEKPIGKELARVLKRSHLAKPQGETLQGRDDKVRLEFEENDLTVAEYNKLKKELKGVILVPTQNRIEDMRMIKRPDEIESIRQAAKLTDQCFSFVLSKLKLGVAEGKVAWEIEKFFRERGAALAFSPIVAFGANSSQPHYQPTDNYSSSEGTQRTSREATLRKFSTSSNDTVLRSNDIVLLDFGAKWNGYCADMTRVVFIGKPKYEWKRAYWTVLKAQTEILQQMQACYHVTVHSSKHVYLSGAQLDQRAKTVIKKAGFPPFPHSLGHAVGLDIHEAPRLTIKKDPSTSSVQVPLKPNMVVTVEPAVYVEGQYGIRIEDLVLLRKDRIEILSKSPKEMTIL